MIDFGVLTAGVRKDLRTVLRYPLGLANVVILSPFYGLILPTLLFGSAFLVGGRAVGLEASAGTTNLAGFVFAGAFVNCLAVGTFIGVRFSVTIERETGTLQQSWLSPVSRATFIAQYATTSVLLALGSGVVVLVAGVVLFGASYLGSVALAAPMLVVVVLGMIGVGYLVAAVILLLRQANLVVDGMSFLFGMLSGTMFPVQVLPAGLRQLAMALPTTYAVDLVRHYGVGTRTVAPIWVEYLAASASAAILLWLGHLAFSAAERRISRSGTLDQY